MKRSICFFAIVLLFLLDGTSSRGAPQGFQAMKVLRRIRFAESKSAEEPTGTINEESDCYYSNKLFHALSFLEVPEGDRRVPEKHAPWWNTSFVDLGGSGPTKCPDCTNIDECASLSATKSDGCTWCGIAEAGSCFDWCVLFFNTSASCLNCLHEILASLQ